MSLRYIEAPASGKVRPRAGNESSRTCLSLARLDKNSFGSKLKFKTNLFLGSSSARLKFTSNSVRLVRFINSNHIILKFIFLFKKLHILNLLIFKKI